MDLGVGSFVFSLGVVSALPLLRRTDPRPYFASVLSSIKKSLPIIALGLVRVIMVKGVDYPVRLIVLHSLIRSDYLTNRWSLRRTGTCIRVWSTMELLLHDGFHPNFRYRARKVRYFDRYALDRLNRLNL